MGLIILSILDVHTCNSCKFLNLKLKTYVKTNFLIQMSRMLANKKENNLIKKH